jgi:putative peptidoglycan lipid II flippase
LALPTIVNGITALDSFTGEAPPSQEKLDLITTLSLWTFPYLFLICLAVFCMAPLFTLKHYSTPSWSPVLLNISIIATCLLFHDSFAEPAYALVIGAWLGGVAQLVVQYTALVKVSGIKYPNFQLSHPAIRQVLWLLVPVIIGQSAGEVNKLVDTLFAASLPDPGTVTNLYAANRLIQLPLSIFAVATSVAILPNLSTLHAKGEHAELRTILMQGMRQSFFFIMPAMAGLFLLGQPVMTLLFERGEFTAHDTDMAATALAYYAGGLLAFAWVKIVVTGFYAMQDTKTPVIIASSAMILNVLLNFALIGPMGYKGLALSTTVSYGLNCVALYMVLSYRMGKLWDGKFISSLVRVLVATVFMSVAAYGSWAFCASQFDSRSLFDKGLVACIPIGVSMAIYALLARALSIPEFEFFVNGLRRRSNR